MSAHAAVVLAAGGSRRLGRPKQLLRRDGEPLVRRAVRLAAETSPDVLLVVVGAQAEAVIAAAQAPFARFLVNEHWPSGRASSLALAASALRTHPGPVLLLACDQPALRAAHLRQLLQGAAAAASGCAATAHGEALGIPAVVSAQWLQQADTLSGDSGFGRRLSALPRDAVWRLRAPELAFDIDTPENEQAAIARGLLDGA